MAGVKGKSGGPRENSGGYRPNSGPKTKPPQPTDAASATEFLRLVMRGEIVPSGAQLDAAKTLARVEAGAVGGKKTAAQAAAKKASTGKFASSDPPKLVVNNR